MKLLLTSGGISNRSIAQALQNIVKKPFSEVAVAFIPTAANFEDGDKGWLVDGMMNFRELKPKLFDIVDISALPKNIWLPRLQNADVLAFSGGNTLHLLGWIKKSGLAELLPGFLKTKVYVGESAGSMVMAEVLLSKQDAQLYYDKMKRESSNNERALGYVPFNIRPHLNNPDFPNVKEVVLEKLAKEVPQTTIYALDDSSAIKIVDDKIEIISEGKWIKYN